MVNHFALMDGLKLAFQEWGRGNARRVLSLHGWLDNSNTFKHLGPHLADRGFHVVGLDFVGHGLSDKLHDHGIYTPQKSIAHIKEVYQHLGWEHSNLVGHSMGAGYSLLFAGTYPEHVEKLVLLEGFGTVTHAASSAAKNLRRAIDSEMIRKEAYAKETGQRTVGGTNKLYPSLGKAIDARLKSVTTYPGKQFLSREAAALLVRRGACLVNGDEESLIDDSMDETIGPVRFLHDQRLLKPAYYYYTGEHILSFVDGITSPTLLMTAEFGWPNSDDHANMEKRIKILTDKKLLTHTHITSASHHLHIDPETAPQVAEHVHNFLASKVITEGPVLSPAAVLSEDHRFHSGAA